MILTVTVNAALDRTVAVPSLRLGRRHRAVESRRAAGGKGVNVARALRRLGHPVIATGFAGGATGRRVVEMLGREGVLTDFVSIEGETRTNLAIIDPTSGDQTEINERGPMVSSADLDRLTDRLEYLASGAALCVIAGSLPPGPDDETYALMIERLRRIGVPVLLDTDGEPMRLGLRAGPAIVAPNAAEAEEAVGHEFADRDDTRRGLAELVEMGASEAVITDRTGCVAVLGEGSERRSWAAEVEPLEPVSSVGSGDAFLAGFTAARRSGETPEFSLALGVACGAESTQHFGAGVLDAEEARRLAERVTVREVDVPAAVA